MMGIRAGHTGVKRAILVCSAHENLRICLSGSTTELALLLAVLRNAAEVGV
jgi:hypothetical protein